MRLLKQLKETSAVIAIMTRVIDMLQKYMLPIVLAQKNLKQKLTFQKIIFPNSAIELPIFEHLQIKIMKKYFTIALLTGALFSFTTASAINCTTANDNLTSVTVKEKKEKKSKKTKKGEETKKGCEGKTGASGCCAGAKKTS